MGLISWALDRGVELGGKMPTSSSSSSSSNLRRLAAPALVVSSGELEASEPSSSSANRRPCQFDPEQERTAHAGVSPGLFTLSFQGTGLMERCREGSRLTGKPREGIVPN